MLNLIIYFAICFLSFSWAVLDCHAQKRNSDTENFLENRITIVLSDIDEEVFLSTFARRANLALGFYQLHGKGEKGARKKVNINVKQATIREVLNLFLEADPRYKWEVLNGIVNVIPLEKPQLLDVSVSKVDFRNIQLWDAELAILDLPEVDSTLMDMGLTASKVSIKYGPLEERPNFSLEMKSTTVQGILNEILNQKYGYFWTVERFGPNFEFIKISLM